MIVTLPAGVSQNITVAGARFYFVDGNGKINVKLKGSGDSRDFDLYPRQGVNSDVRFAGLEITNISDEEQTIEFEISDREVFDNRIPEVTQIEPLDGVMPVELSANPGKSGWVKFSTNLPDYYEPFGVGVLLALEASSVSMLVKGVAVRLKGDAWAKELALGVALESARLTSVKSSWDRRSMSVVGNGEVALPIDIDDVYVVGFVAGALNEDTLRIEEMVTSTDMTLRNAYFDFSDRPIVVTPGLPGDVGLTAYVESLDIAERVKVGEEDAVIEVAFFGEFLS